MKFELVKIFPLKSGRTESTFEVYEYNNDEKRNKAEALFYSALFSSVKRDLRELTARIYEMNKKAKRKTS